MISTASTSSVAQSSADTNTTTVVMFSADRCTDSSTTCFVLISWFTTAGVVLTSSSDTVTSIALNRYACDAPGDTRHVLNTPLSANGTSTSSFPSTIGTSGTASSQLARTNFRLLPSTKLPLTAISPTSEAAIGRPVTQRSTLRPSSVTAVTLPSSTKCSPSVDRHTARSPAVSAS